LLSEVAVDEVDKIGYEEGGRDADIMPSMTLESTGCTSPSTPSLWLESGPKRSDPDPEVMEMAEDESVDIAKRAGSI
jgi:hypothetical protein